MAQEFKDIFDNNIYLKKNLQIERHKVEKLQQELGEERLLRQEMVEKNTALNESYNLLQKRFQMQAAEHNKDITILTSQIEELKELIEKKQQELEEFQLKIIPNIDQDMIRVKLITEMEGPYQEVVQKKDKEILKLKQRLTDAERKNSLLQLQLETKEKELKRDVEDCKRYYQTQTEKLTKDLRFALSKKEGKTYDKELFKNQRKELEELRYTIHLQSQNQTELRKQVSTLKIQREKLLIQINQLNEKKALQIHLSSENEEIRSLKQDRNRLEAEVARKMEELQKLEKKHRAALTAAKAGQQELRKKVVENRQIWDHQKESYKEEISKQKSEISKNKDRIDRLQEDLQVVVQRFKNSERELNARNQEISRLKDNISELQLTIKQYELSKKQKLTLSKNFQGLEKPTKKDDSFDEDKKENEEKKRNVIINKQDKNQKNLEIIQNLQKMNAKLKEKLEKANEKIVILLKEKAVGGGQAYLPGNSRDRAFSNIQLDSMKQRTDRAFLLEYRDASFTPLVPPTIFTQPI